MTVALGAPSFLIVNKDQAMSMKSPALKLMEEMAENVTVLEAHGRLDSTTAQQFGDRLVALVQAGQSAILVDLKNIIYISSAGFQALLIANRTTAESQGKLALCGVIGGVKRLFEISSLKELFLICQTRADGIAKLRDDRQNSSRPENPRLNSNEGDIMWGWGIGASVGLIFASLTFASGIGPAVASYECGHRYRMCNVGCNQAIVSNNAVCRLQCDLLLVACDQTKAKDSADDDGGGGEHTADTVHERPSPDQHTR